MMNNYTADYKFFQEHQQKSRRFPVFPGGISNSRRFPVFPVVDTLNIYNITQPESFVSYKAESIWALQ